MRETGAVASVIALLVLASCSQTAITGLERALSAQPSATAVLQQRCAEPIAAVRLKAEAPALPVAWRAQLALPQGAAPGFRHVELRCGTRVLSVADNWYVPERLTPEMNALLDTTDTPFGKVATPLGFTRERLESRRGRAGACPPGTVLSQRGLLRLSDGRPLALVVECYTGASVD